MSLEEETKENGVSSGGPSAESNMHPPQDAESVTRRKVLKAAVWVTPVVISVALPTEAFAQSSPGGGGPGAPTSAPAPTGTVAPSR